MWHDGGEIDLINCLAEVIFGLDCTIVVWSERGKNQHSRLLRSKVEQKLNMEEVVKMDSLMHGQWNWDFSVEESSFNEHIVMTI